MHARVLITGDQPTNQSNPPTDQPPNLEPPKGDVGVARRFFTALASEPAGSRAALQEAVGSLAGAYALAAERRGQGADAAAGQAVEAGLQELLLGALGSDQPAVRLCAIQVGC
jgi:hypothetical protein